MAFTTPLSHVPKFKGFVSMKAHVPILVQGLEPAEGVSVIAGLDILEQIVPQKIEQIYKT